MEFASAFTMVRGRPYMTSHPNGGRGSTDL